MTKPLELSDRLTSLFTSNPRSSGRWNPTSGRAYVEYLPIDAEVMDEHLEGSIGCGGVPILDDGTCYWAAIDIDNHGEDADTPIEAIERNIRTLNLPLVVCRSKSGGVHAYIFFKDLQPCNVVRELMASYATKLGYLGAEVFPKQSKLHARDGKMSFGNWINFPYFNVAETNRYAVLDGKKLSLEEFLAHAESIKVTRAGLTALILADHPDAPPCIQALLSKGAAEGQRNEAMYNVGVYFRKLDPNAASIRAVAANQYLFKNPLPKAELTRTINSSLKPDYGYRCGEEVIKQYCDRPTCLTRKCGITEGEAEKNDTYASLPNFMGLIKYMSEPVRWEMIVEGIRVFNISTAELLDWRFIRQLIADRLTRVAPMIKNTEWERILAPLMGTARVVETPDDASIAGIIRDRLREFAAKTDLASRGEDPEERKGLIRGMPVVQKMDGDRCVLFRGQDFVNYLKRTKSEELKGVNLWFAVQDLGVMHRKVRIGAKDSCNVWYLPVKTVVQDFAAEPVDFKAEL